VPLNLKQTNNDELPVLRFIVNPLYRPIIRVPNWVALGLEIIAENFYYYS